MARLHLTDPTIEIAQLDSLSPREARMKAERMLATAQATASVLCDTRGAVAVIEGRRMLLLKTGLLEIEHRVLDLLVEAVQVHRHRERVAAL